MARSLSLDPTRDSLKRHALAGYLITGVLFGGLGIWATFTEIDGAVAANGVVVVEGGARKVQHQEGGIVRLILVKNGDVVSAGQVLIEVDGTSVEASLAVIEAQLSDELAHRVRLFAESTGRTILEIPVVPNWAPDANFSKALLDQQALLDAKHDSLAQQASRLQEQKRQLAAQLDGLGRQRLATAEQLEIVEDEGSNLDKLQQAQLANASRVNTNRTDRARLNGEIGRLLTEAAAVQAAMTEKDQEIAQLDIELRAKALDEMQDVSLRISELLQQRVAAKDQLDRLQVRAPVAGIVHESRVQTVGGVIAPAEALMSIVPPNADVLVDLHVSPVDIDKVEVGQAVEVRFLSFDSRTVEDVPGRVTILSPSTSVDPVTNAGFYTVRVDVDDPAIPGKQRARVFPGMPAEAFVKTGARTVLAYLMKPLMDQILHTFRED